MDDETEPRQWSVTLSLSQAKLSGDDYGVRGKRVLEVTKGMWSQSARKPYLDQCEAQW